MKQSASEEAPISIPPLTKPYLRTYVLPELLFRWVLCGLGASVLCSCDIGDPVSKVKNGTLSFDKSTTVGKALDRYKYFKKTEWKSSKTDNDRTFVEFRGNIDVSSITARDFDESMAAITGSSSGAFGDSSKDQNALMRAKEAYSGAQVVIQFLVNSDDTFEIKDFTIRRKSADTPGDSTDALAKEAVGKGVFAELSGNAEVTPLKQIYDNALLPQILETYFSEYK